MTVSSWLRTPRLRRAFALTSVVLATGGLVLYRAPAGAAVPGVYDIRTTKTPLVANGKNSVAFSGPGAHGVLSLSHTKVLSGQTTPVYAELRVEADPLTETITVGRAPISIAVVLDTSGSMSGEKIADAKRSVLRLLGDMRDDDEIAVVRYSDTSELIQPLARVGSVRSSLTARIHELRADGGTNIPGGMAHGLRALDESAKGRVRRIVLVSDGLDSTRAQAESLARSSFSSGITVSSLGIGLDFDESYMGAIAQNGHGNFVFVKDGGSLATFLKRELDETALTTVENARVRVRLPSSVRFVSATGADATVRGDEVELALGSLFAGDQRRVVLELASTPYDNVNVADIRATATWNRVGAEASAVEIPKLSLVATSDADAVESGRDGAVLASSVSVIASKRQVQATNAYARGDVEGAAALAEENDRALKAAASAAPPEALGSLNSQMNAYSDQKRSFRAVAPSSVAGKAAAKSATVKELDNLSRKAW